jgi:hypothetical protein
MLLIIRLVNDQSIFLEPVIRLGFIILSGQHLIFLIYDFGAVLVFGEFNYCFYADYFLPIIFT